MARSKLNTLKQEINQYIGIPYWANKLDDGKIILNGPYGGKGSHKQIEAYTKRLIKKNGLSTTKLTKQNIYNLQKKNHLGIDCSGLTYHLLDFWAKLNLKTSIKKYITGTDGKFGPRRVNVQSLAKKVNSFKVDKIPDIKTADMIVINRASHVLFVINKTANFIYYVHSSQFTKKRGVHLGRIKILNPSKDLGYQRFSDITNQGIPYHKQFDPDKGDAIYRLHIFKNS